MLWRSRATSSPPLAAQVFNLEGEMLHSYKHHTNFLGEAVAPTASLAFHPIRPMLAAATYDRVVTIYSPNK